jgi:5-hydroxyisourate hydrolase-like protein (transthyretin family)
MDESIYGEIAQVVLTGRIVGADGAAIAGATVEGQATYGDGSGLVGSTVSAGDGTFTLTALTARPFAVLIKPNAPHVMATLTSGTELALGTPWGSATPRVFEPVDGSSATLGDLELTTGVTIEGTVDVAGSLPPTPAVVNFASATSGTRFSHDIVIESGLTSWAVAVPSGAYEVTMNSWEVGIEERHPSTLSVPASGPVPAIDFSVQVEDRTLSGVVRNASGEPVAGVRVSAYQPDGGGNGRGAITDGDGSYTLYNLPAGSYLLAFYGTGPAMYWPGTTEQSDAHQIVIQSESTALTDYDVLMVEGVTISGKVVDADGTPRPNLTINLYRSGEAVRSVESRPDGTYSATGLPAGEYTSELQQGGWNGLRQWYDAKRRADDADLIVVSAPGDEIDGIDFELLEGAKISGTITLENGDPVPGAIVEVFYAHDLFNAVGQTTTDTEGRYSVGDLASDSYLVRASSGSSGIVDTWFDATGAGSPTVTTIEEGTEATANIVTRFGGTFRGTVLSTVPGVHYGLSLTRVDAEGFRWMSIHSESGGDVAWEISGLDGTWIVQLDNVYWEDTTSFDDATRITAHAGSAIEGIDFNLAASRTITGSIAVSDASGFGDGHVTLERLDGDYWTWVDSAWIQSPSFSMSAPLPGRYRVKIEAYAANQLDRLRDIVQEFDVPNEETVELELTTMRGWAISGRVIDAATGSPIANTNVTLSGESAGMTHSAYTQADGTYYLPAGTPGGWSVEAGRGSVGYLPASIATTIGDSDVRGLTIALSPGSGLSGRVTAETSGNPLANIEVAVFREGGDQVAWATTDSNGRYSTEALPAGAYEVRFDNLNGLYVSEWWDSSTHRDSAATVDPRDDDADGVDASLGLGGKLTGTVVDSGGSPLAWARVGIATARPNDVESFMAPLMRLFSEATDSPILDSDVWTDGAGNFSMSAVAAGSYTLFVQDQYTGGTTWFDAKSTWADSNSVEVRVGESTHVVLTTRALADGESPRTPEESLSEDFAIQLQPSDASVQDGTEGAHFRTAASGLPTPEIIWQVKRSEDADFTTEGWGSSFWLEASMSNDGAEVRAVATQGASSLTSRVASLTVLPAPTPPDTPSAPTVSDITNTTATLSWTGLDDSSHHTLRIYSNQLLVKELVVRGTTLVPLADLQQGTTYVATISAHNEHGESSESTGASFRTSATTAPSAPRSVLATAGDAKATVFWNAPSSNGGSAITSYTVTGMPGGHTATAAGTQAIITGLANGTAYTFTVTATNAAGTSPASAASAPITPMAAVTAPGSPTGVSASGGDKQATVTWNAPTSTGGSTITKYTVTANPGGETTTTTGATTATLTGLTNGTAYTFTVTATNAAGTSPASAASAPITPIPSITRAGGADRFDTSAKISAATFEPGVPVVYLANGLAFPDALSGAAAAGNLGGPVLLTLTGEIPASIRAELDRLNPGRIVILGGTGAVNNTVADAVQQYIR